MTFRLWRSFLQICRIWILLPPIKACCPSIVWVCCGEGGWGQVANCRGWSRKYFGVSSRKYWAKSSCGNIGGPKQLSKTMVKSCDQSKAPLLGQKTFEEKKRVSDRYIWWSPLSPTFTTDNYGVVPPPTPYSYCLLFVFGFWLLVNLA